MLPRGAQGGRNGGVVDRAHPNDGEPRRPTDESGCGGSQEELFDMIIAV